MAAAKMLACVVDFPKFEGFLLRHQLPGYKKLIFSESLTLQVLTQEKFSLIFFLWQLKHL